MIRLSTIRRRLLLGSGFVLLLSGLSLIVVHTSIVRRFALVQIQTRLGNTLGLAIHADELNYNLLSGRFELKDVIVRGRSSRDLPVPLKVRRLVVLVPTWSLIHGALDAARIRIDGLSVQWVTDREGRSNWPEIRAVGPGGKPGGPSIVVTGAQLNLRDDHTGLLVHLPIGQLSAAWNPVRRQYKLVCQSAGGQIQWNGSHVTLDRLRLESAIADGGVIVESLRVASADSQAEVTGKLYGSPVRIEGAADLDVDLRPVSQLLKLTTPASGRLRTHLSLAGPLQAMQLTAAVLGEDIVVDGIPILHPSAEAAFDTATGELQLSGLSAGLFSGQLKARGRLWMDSRRRSELIAGFNAIDLKHAAAAFGAAGVSSNIPFGRATLDLSASCPGLDWRRAIVSGVARSRSAKVSLRATGSPGSIRTLLDVTLGAGAAMQADLAIKLPARALTGAVHGKINSLAEFAGQLESWLDRPAGSLAPDAVNGTAHWSATIGGSTSRPSASLQLDVNNLGAGGWTGADLHVSAEYAGTRIGIPYARLAWAGQKLEANGEIAALSAEAPLLLQGTIDGPSLAPVFRSLGISPAAEAAVAGEFRLQGTLAHPAAEAKLHTGELTALGQRFTSTSFEAHFQDDQITVHHLRAEQVHDSGAPGQIEASASLRLAAGQYEINSIGRDLRPVGLPITGTFGFNLAGKGMLNVPCFNAQVDGAGIQVGSVPVGELRANIDVEAHRAAVKFVAPALNTEASGTIAMESAWPFELALSARNAHLDTAQASSFDATMHANGTLAQPHLERVAAEIQNLRLALPGQDVVGDGPIQLSFADNRIQVSRLRLNSGTSAAQISGDMPLRDGGEPGSLSVQGSIGLQSLSQILPGSGTSRIQGTAEVDARITGSLQNWQPSGAITIHDGGFHSDSLPVSIQDIAGRLNLENGLIRFDQIGGKAGTGTLRIAGSVPLHLISTALPAPAVSQAQPARLSAVLDNFAISGGSGEDVATANLAVKVEAEASSMSTDALRATVEFTEFEAIAKGNHLRQTSPTRIALSGGIATLERFDLKGTGSSLQASGSLGLAGGFPLQLRAVGQTDLTILSALLPPLQTSGAARLDVRVGGTLSSPQTSGFVELDGATLSLSNPKLRAGNVKAHAELQGDLVTFTELSGNLNGGTFRGGGELKVGSEGLHDVNLFLTAKDTFAEYPASVKTVSSLDLKFVSRQDRLVLEGQIAIQEGFHESTLDLFRSGPNLNFGLDDISKSSSKPVALDIAIVTKRPVEMDNNLGRLSAAADLRLAGDVNQVRLLGKLELEQDGKLYFGDRVYYITRGAINFLDAPKITPELNIQAWTRTGDYTIRLGLTGELDAITTTFTSDPPLSRDDVIAVLLTGKTVAENRGVDLRALEAASLAAGAMNASLSSQLRRTIGISRVSIQPSAIAAESNNPGTRITVTQDFTSSLRLLYSMNLSDSNDQIWVGEYDLSRQFTTRAVKQSDNTYRGEFRHDIRFGSSSAAGSAPVRPVTRKISNVQFVGATPWTPEALTKVFKIKPGQKYNPMKVRKAAERLNSFLVKQGYLESRVHLDRQEAGQSMGLTVRIETGPPVQLTVYGVNLPKRQKTRLRDVWHTGISDQQRPQAGRDALLNYFARKGYLRAKTECYVATVGDRKSVRFDVIPGIQYRKIGITVEGAERRRAKEILSLVQQRSLKQSVYRDPARVIEAITSFYLQRGYLAASVVAPVQNLDTEYRKARIVIPVREGPLFHVGALQFSGNRALPPTELLHGAPLESGAVFEPARLEPTLAALKLKYGELGYRDAGIEYAVTRHDDRALVDVTFTVVENLQTSIAGITVEGNWHTSAKFVKGQLRVAPGEVANSTRVRESVKNLSQTGAFTSADIQMRAPAVSGAGVQPIQVADLVVSVAEPKPFRLLYGGLYDSGNGPGFIADLQNHNSLGAGRVIGLRARLDSETTEARLYVSRPFWNQHRLSTTFSTYYTRETEYLQTTPTEKLGVSVQQDVQLRSKWLLSYGYRYEKQRGFIPDPAAPDIPVEIVSVAPLTLTFSRDGRDSFLDATRGSFVSHGFEFAPRFLGSDYPYVRYYGQYFKYFPLIRPRPVPFGEKENRSRLVFATGSRVGLQKGFSKEGAVLTDRFFAGGGTTIRGFHQDELGPRLANGQPAGGNAVLVLNEELRFPLFWVFDAVSFVDVGNVFPRVSDFRFSELRTATGFGLRIRNPFVVLRLDYGFKLERRPGEKLGAFFFSIGQAF